MNFTVRANAGFLAALPREQRKIVEQMQKQKTTPQSSQDTHNHMQSSSVYPEGAKQYIESLKNRKNKADYICVKTGAVYYNKKYKLGVHQPIYVERPDTGEEEEPSQKSISILKKIWNDKVGVAQKFKVENEDVKEFKLIKSHINDNLRPEHVKKRDGFNQNKFRKNMEFNLNDQGKIMDQWNIEGDNSQDYLELLDSNF